MNGERLSQIGIGGADLGRRPFKEAEAIHYGLEHGINVVDTAESYPDSEELIKWGMTDIDRQQVFLISKVLPSHATPDQERRSLEGSLKRLGVDYLDLYLLHWRANADLTQAVAGLEQLKQEGLIRHWGVSNFDVKDMEDLLKVPHGDQCFANEDLYNLTSRGVEYDLLPWQAKHQVGFLGYSPFHAVGWNYLHPTKVLRDIAAAHDTEPYPVMLAWITRNNNLVTLPKAATVDHVKANIAAMDLKLTDQELAMIDREYPAPTKKVPLEKI
ncbi:aldo/keto reductase [Limosilactobacillus pontis]|uniref:aldo/keto reductase n=1 Tax=Limosilactobacillus pontis TaxID=35787 RepID=UPI0022471FCC|nr:aldo/keto reductase [Limosilactobacillus pontis]MCX2186223.1 aldo/keto reductase [Limosilactobacillus pontis]MCX2187909.1 aldo/keto reductase [Limosilactobacillus pontis]